MSSFFFLSLTRNQFESCRLLSLSFFLFSLSSSAFFDRDSPITSSVMDSQRERSTTFRSHLFSPLLSRFLLLSLLLILVFLNSTDEEKKERSLLMMSSSSLVNGGMGLGHCCCPFSLLSFFLSLSLFLSFFLSFFLPSFSLSFSRSDILSCRRQSCCCRKALSRSKRCLVTTKMYRYDSQRLACLRGCIHGATRKASCFLLFFLPPLFVFFLFFLSFSLSFFFSFFLSFSLSFFHFLFLSFSFAFSFPP